MPTVWISKKLLERRVLEKVCKVPARRGGTKMQRDKLLLLLGRPHKQRYGTTSLGSEKKTNFHMKLEEKHRKRQNRDKNKN